MDVGVYAPLATPKPVAPSVWIVDGPPERMTFGLGFQVPFPTRMTIVRLAGGALWCHSPIAPDDALFAAVDGLGTVAHLVSPNRIHYAHVAAWQRRYPAAIAWASPGVRARAAAQRIEVRFDRDLGDAAPDAWSGEIAQLVFEGSRVIAEVVFFHRASATLILADLIENFEKTKLRGAWRWLARLGGVVDPDGKAPLDMRVTFRDRERARASLARMLAWKPERVLLAHGRPYLGNGEAELRRAFRWLAPAPH